MYSNSDARLKIVKKLSAKFPIEAGTEQGHPMSPELFKIFVHELSVELARTEGINTPVLNEVHCSHLLWADDLVLMALDKQSLQKMIEVLHGYCSDWGLIVNLSKTAVLIFNRSGKLLIESHGFIYDGEKIPAVKEYCYLGITFTASGSTVRTQVQLRQKALRAYFAMKKYIDPSAIGKDGAVKLFDALIRPIVSYGHQVWLPSTKGWETTTTKKSPEVAFKNLATDPLEKLHITYLKWMLQVPRRTSNTAVLGDYGRYPLAIALTKTTLDYSNRLQLMDKEGSNNLVRHAFVEQRKLDLNWYCSIRTLTDTHDPQSQPDGAFDFPNSTLCMKRCKDRFKEMWDVARTSNKKLEFYNSIKSSFEYETYLNNKNTFDAKLTTLLRSGSHLLNIEKGRHGKNRESRLNRRCPFCADREQLDLLEALPFPSDIVMENEEHVLSDCPAYEEIRSQANDKVREALLQRNFAGLFQPNIAAESGILVRYIFKKRFPDYKFSRHQRKAKKRVERNPP